jgi:hypothetical protein
LFRGGGCCLNDLIRIFKHSNLTVVAFVVVVVDVVGSGVGG